ncbi:truncated basic helix-loop-helix protein A isoform X2 [Cryptomeria japonica]|uniref:truncated basic helix-loop-helix protein A isoform X2 n=1 Tax=Cryptomeria japonica TaxID=3369 RepID=UPI0027DA32B3|nr:truncated basic helix-loop-helix protein A isoform X2 [Cryptomeria japonica]
MQEFHGCTQQTTNGHVESTLIDRQKCPTSWYPHSKLSCFFQCFCACITGPQAMCPGNLCHHGQAWEDEQLAINNLTKGLQAAVKSIQWTYSIYWKYCPYHRLLKWGGGYYNGRMNGTKMEDGGLQRTLKLRELYECLCSGREGEGNQWKPFSALTPEDLTDTEWFYFVSMTFTFAASFGLPGQALANGSPMWLFGANEADSKVFRRSLLAKSASIQTVICIPLIDGVLELGSNDLVIIFSSGT